MSHLYAILAYIGWIWTAIVLIAKLQERAIALNFNIQIVLNSQRDHIPRREIQLSRPNQLLQPVGVAQINGRYGPLAVRPDKRPTPCGLDGN